jgi:hypothetical protein
MRFALAILALCAGTAGAATAAINPADLDKLTVYEKAWDDSAEDKAPEAREAFAGRGGDLVEHFLRAHRGRPRTGAYAFVLRALADVDSTLALIDALRTPPQSEEGATVRQPAEIAALVGTSTTCRRSAATRASLPRSTRSRIHRPRRRATT